MRNGTPRIIADRDSCYIWQRNKTMTFRKGEFGLYDCRERLAGGRLLLAFIAGLVFDVVLMVCLFFYYKR